MKTAQCPSCGATATNLLNCEFCGSLFVRYSDLNISTENILSSDGKLRDFVFPGLEEQLRKNLSLQTEKNFIVTDITLNNEVLPQVVASCGIPDLFNDITPSFPGLAIYLPFTKVRQSEYEKFLSLDEHRLFTHTYEEQGDVHMYVIDFGNDAIGAAYLVSKIMVTVNGISKNSLLSYKTEDFSDSSSDEPAVEKKGNCFVATATMGNYNHPVVLDLRIFRDEWILKRSWGKDFVNWYYKYGRLLANQIQDRNIIRKICYLTVIKPIHLVSKILIK